MPEPSSTPFAAAPEPRLFDLRLPALPLSRGGTVDPHHARGWWWGPAADLPALEAQTHPLAPAAVAAARSMQVVRRAAPLPHRTGAARLAPEVPTVLLVHALTGDARAGGEGGWWEPLIGPGRPLDPSRVRLICFNNLGSCYGSTGPLEPGFPESATLTSRDQAAAILQALDVLGVDRLALVAGGSLGGMVALWLAALAPARVERLLPIAAAAASSAWVVGWNHIAREVLRLDPGWPEDLGRGLELARQLAMLTYRAEPGLELFQGRHLPCEPGAAGALRIQGYLEHQGSKLRRRFDGRCYLQLLSAMDSHDLLRPAAGETGPPPLSRIRASTLAVEIDTDQLFSSAQVGALAQGLTEAGAHVERAMLTSLHGHDAFLIEWAAMGLLVRQALGLPGPRQAAHNAAPAPTRISRRQSAP